jgi:hypothetical protein
MALCLHCSKHALQQRGIGRLLLGGGRNHSDIKTITGHSRWKLEAVASTAAQVLDFRAKNGA